MPYKAWLLPNSCLTIHWGHRCQVLVCMSLRPKEDMLIPEIREHVSLTNDCGVSHRQDQPSPSIKVFLLNVFVLHWLRIKFRDRMQFRSLIYFQTCYYEKSPKWMKKRVLCAGMWDASDTELTSNCFTPTEAQHDRLGLLLTTTREFSWSAHNWTQYFKRMTKSGSCLGFVLLTQWSSDLLLELIPQSWTFLLRCLDWTLMWIWALLSSSWSCCVCFCWLLWCVVLRWFWILTAPSLRQPIRKRWKRRDEGSINGCIKLVMEDNWIIALNTDNLNFL